MYMLRPAVSTARVVGHTALVVFTGGLWLIPLTVRFLLTNA